MINLSDLCVLVSLKGHAKAHVNTQIGHDLA